MASQFEAGTYAIPAPRPEEDAVSSYVEIADAQQQIEDDDEWKSLLGQSGTAPVSAPQVQDNAQGTQTAQTAPSAPQAAETGAGGDVTGETWQDFAKAALMDVGEGVVEAPRQAVGGVMDAFSEAGQFLGDLTGLGAIQFRDPETGGFALDLLSQDELEAQQEEFGTQGLVEALTPEEADSTTGAFVRGTAQFLTGFLPALKGTRALGITGAVSSSAVAGAVADAVVFDPHEDRLSTFLNEFPALEPFVSDYLADNNPENESNWEGRFKNTLEGVGFGLASDGAAALFRSFKYYKAQRSAASQFAPGSTDASIEAAKDAMADAARRDLVPDVPEEAIAPLGVPDAPMIVTGKPDETSGVAFTRIKAAEQRVARSKIRAEALGNIGRTMETRTPDEFDELINAVRKGGVTADLGGKRPVSGIVKGLGGVEPGSGLAAELKSNGVTPRTHPGLFRKGGLSDLDNIPVSEQPIFSARQLDDGQGFVPQQSWIDALADEGAGNPWRSIEQQRAFDDTVAPVEALGEELERLGIDVTELSNDSIRRRMDEITAEEAEFNRPSTPEDAQPASLEDIQDAELPDQARPGEQTFPQQALDADGNAIQPEGRVFINHARIQTSDDVKQVLQEMADLDADNIEAKTRGTVTNVQTIDESSKEYQNLDDLIGRPPGPMSAAQAVAARKLLVSSGEQLVDLARKASSPEASAADVYNFRRAMSVHYAIQSEVVAARTETARALQSWAIPTGSDKVRGEAINQLLRENGGAGDLQSLAKAVANSAGNPTAINTMARETLRSRTGKALYQVWINGLLSSPKTHIVNALSNSMVAAYAIPERYMAAGISKAFYRGELDVGEASAMAYGQVKSIRDAFRFMYLGNKAEGGDLSDLFDNFSKSEVHSNAISSEAFGLNPAGSFGRGFDLLGRTVNLPGNMLEVSDRFFKTIGYRGELNALAYRKAMAEGLDGDDAARSIADTLANPPENLVADALDVAHYNTFTNELGKTGQAFQTAVRKIPGLKLVLPFIRTPTNIVKYTFARTPLAYMSSAIRADVKAGGSRAAQAHARVALGSMMMLYMADLTTEGTITGRGPEDPRMRKIRMQEGWRPYSVKVGDRWFQYSRTDPIGMIMGIGADIAELTTNANDEESEMMATAAVMALANNLANKTYMSGIYDFIGAIDPSNPTSDPGKYLQNFTSGMVPFSSFVRNVAGVTDPVLRETRTAATTAEGEDDAVATYFESMLASVRSKIPGMGEDLPPRRDLYGEPIDRSSGIGWAYDLISPIASKADNPDPITRVLIDNKVPVSAPPRLISGVRLNAEEYSEFSRISGEMLKEHLGALIKNPQFKRLSEGPDGMKSELIMDTIRSTRDIARAQMLRDFPRLQQLSFQRQTERLQTLQGN